MQFQGEQARLAKEDQIPPSVFEKPRIIKDDSKKTVRIEVRMKSKPEAQVDWFREKQHLSNGKKYIIATIKQDDNFYLQILEILVCSL